jgi:alkylation response protein AidB-like acyl-CoA dehydrogenase
MARMDFELTDEQRSYRESVLEFARRELDGTAEDGFSRDRWERCARIGIQGLPVPGAHGGGDASPVTIVAALEALGQGCADNGLVFALNAQLWGLTIPLVEHGSDQQRERYLPRLCDGSLIGAHAMTEPGSGSDAFSLRTRAERRGEDWVLTGSKTFVTNAPDAGLFLVFATTNHEAGVAGLCAFLVERDTPGLSVGPPLQKMGLRSAPMSELFLDDCAVGDGQLLGRAGRGAAVFTEAMLWERGLIMAAAVGTMQRQLERCVAYAREREQFGRPIGEFQAVAHRIAGMKLRLETARLLLYRLAWLLEQGEASAMDAALTKLHLSESFVTSSLDALQVHGGYGYMTESALERDVRDALASRIYSGTSDMQRTIVARGLGL